MAEVEEAVINMVSSIWLSLFYFSLPLFGSVSSTCSVSQFFNRNKIKVNISSYLTQYQNSNGKKKKKIVKKNDRRFK